MEDNNRKADLRIDGSGSAGGGSYETVRINGSGKINGDVACTDFSINGSGSVYGAVQSDTFRINGSGNVRGKVTGRELKVNGSGDFGEGIDCESVTISGSADLQKGLKANSVKINGSAKIKDDVSAEQFQSKGLFEIGGLLNADDINVRLYWHRSRAREIGGEKISVRLGNDGFGVLRAIFTLGMHNPGLDADTIEGDEIFLENTTAKVVRGNNVTIGAGCEIGLVEYRGTYQKDADAKVTEEKKL